VKGYDTTNGSTGRINKPSTRDSDVRNFTFPRSNSRVLTCFHNLQLITFIREAGGIPFVKTNVPQTLLSFECANPVWGVSSNPYSKNHTPGGSSGGEAAILAMDGAVLGWGSDMAGSLRIPAHYCGIYSLKPGRGRITTSNNSCTYPSVYRYRTFTELMSIVMLAIDPGFKNVPLTHGPMGRGVDDLEAAARAVIGRRGSGKFYFPAPIPYRDVQLPKKLKFGYYLMDGLVKASPACKRAVLETAGALRREGHECVEFDVPWRKACIPEPNCLV
jgi:Asp-tRNA(Asn)/Glu-tRNA(Gln) amidotransferase A subunit family amidase